jgi:hypothetical protein
LVRRALFAAAPAVLSATNAITTAAAMTISQINPARWYPLVWIHHMRVSSPALQKRELRVFSIGRVPRTVGG